MRNVASAMLILAGVVALAVAVIGLVRGRVGFVRLASRGQAGVALGAAFALMLVGGAVSPQKASNSGSLVAEGSSDDATPSPSPTPPARAEQTQAAPEPTYSPAPDPLPTDGDRLVPLPLDVQEARVEHHTDGDTLALRAYVAGKVLSSTSQITVRLLEIDTPETRMPGTPIQCFGPQASARLAQLAPIGAKVYVAADQDRTDRYGRDLLYLWDAQGSSINLAMVEGGYARAVLYAPNDRYITVMRAAQSRAKAANLGLWNACTAPVPVKTTSKPAPVPARTSAPSRGSCDPSYPTVCIPPSPPDLDCGEISYRRFEVVAPDPHRFDADHDGVGCESG